MSYAVTIGQETIPYMVREKTRAKRLTVHVTPGLVEIMAPKATPEIEIIEFAHDKRRWLLTTVERVNEKAKRAALNAPSMPEHCGSCGKIPYRGRMMPLHVEQNASGHITVTYRNGFHVAVPASLTCHVEGQIRRELQGWMRYRLAQDCLDIARRYGKKLNLTPKRISVKTRQQFWGYCSRDGILGISWRLIFVPRQILEYVVVHELCHLKHRVHSDEFWNLVSGAFPDWQQCQTWLEQHEAVWSVQF